LYFFIDLQWRGGAASVLRDRHRARFIQTRSHPRPLANVALEIIKIIVSERTLSTRPFPLVEGPVRGHRAGTRLQCLQSSTKKLNKQRSENTWKNNEMTVYTIMPRNNIRRPSGAKSEVEKSKDEALEA
jgi:hypothetical protein